MDDRQAALKEKLNHLLREAAEVEVELSRADEAIVGIPSPEGTLFETMRAYFRAGELTQPDVGSCTFPHPANVKIRGPRVGLRVG